MSRKGALASATACLILSGLARADILYMNDGTEIEGRIVGDYPSHVVILVRGRQISVRKQDIDTIQIETPRGRTDAIKLPPKPSPAPPASPPATSADRASAAVAAVEKALGIESESSAPRTQVGRRDAGTATMPLETAGKDTGAGARTDKIAEKPQAGATGGKTEEKLKEGKEADVKSTKEKAEVKTVAGITGEGIKEGTKTEEKTEVAKEKGKETPGKEEATEEMPAAGNAEAPLSEEEMRKIEAELEKVCLGPWAKAEPAVEKAINELLEKAAGFDPSKAEERREIRRKLVGFAADAVPYLAKNLTHQEEKVRTMCAEALADMASSDAKTARIALRHMILVISAEGVAPPKGGVIAWYQRDFVQALGRALGILTGIKGVPDNPRSPRAREEMLQFLDWWEKNRKSVEEPQLGEPVIEKSDILYARKIGKIHKLREITEKDMLKLSFPPPPNASPVEVATGRKQKHEDAAIERPADRNFKKAVPVVADEDAGGLIRKRDKEYLKDFFR
ncbi:MAG: hypothetical protein N3A38_00465 [Planctomycetota bacterium]|nr:hypothetical protein [Planctomycetota bacterium]